LQQQDILADLGLLTHQQKSELHQSCQAMQLAVGQRLLLQRRRSKLTAQLDKAAAMFQAERQRKQQGVDEQQVAQVADEMLKQEEEAAGDGDDASDEAGAEDAAGLEDEEDAASDGAAAFSTQPEQQGAAVCSQPGGSATTAAPPQAAAAAGHPLGAHRADVSTLLGQQVRRFAGCTFPQAPPLAGMCSKP
jgi:hypothetical protein